VFRVIAPAMAPGIMPVLRGDVSLRRQGLVLVLAVGALLLGFLPLRQSQLLEIGRPVAVVVR
jgi:hypothetical protein